MSVAPELARGNTMIFNDDYMHLGETDKQRVDDYIDGLAERLEQRAAKAATA
jgi:hypothetical protein